VVTTSTALATIAFWFYDIFCPGHPILMSACWFSDSSGIFVLGLLLIPIGIWVRRRGLLASGKMPAVFPPSIWVCRLCAAPRIRSVATVLNLLIVGTASYRGVEYMDSVNFCGKTCHTVMDRSTRLSEFSPLAVACVECHIGPGAGWFVKSKLSGLRQVLR